jgi:hypothetical protein
MQYAGYIVQIARSAAQDVAEMSHPEPSPRNAQCGWRFWHRHPDETFEQFELRVLKDIITSKNNDGLPTFY